LKLKYGTLSNFAFNISLRQYTVESPPAAAAAPSAGAGAAHGDVPRNKDGSVDYTKDFFGKPSYLTAGSYTCPLFSST
jgi:hypothetical protein